MKIALLIHKLTYSGAPKMLSWVANQMAEKGHEVSIVSFFSDEQAHVINKNIAFKSLKIKQSKSRFVRNTVGMIKTVRALHKYIKAYDPDLIVSFLDSVGYVYLAINKIFGKRKIVISERVDPYIYRGFVSKIRFRLMRYASGTVFQTQGAKDFFKGDEAIYKNSVVIPNPVIIKPEVAENIDSYKALFKDRDNRIVSVGRLSLKQKRQDVMIDAFAKVHAKHPELSLVIYGDGESKPIIEDIVEKSGLRDCIKLAGRTNNVEKEIYNARAFVISSDFEGIPNSLIEAMAIGVPSVSTDCSPGGARLLIENGENAFLTPRGDSDELAKCLNILVENEDISTKFSHNSRNILNQYSEKKIGDLWENYFIEIVNLK